MRTPLKYIERIDQYILGEMNATEKIAFETELKNSEELQSAYSNHLLIQQAIQRKAILQQVEMYAPKITGANVFWTKFKWPIILSSIAILVISSYAMINYGEKTEENQNPTKKNSKLPNSQFVSSQNSNISNSSESKEIDFVKDWERTFLPNRFQASQNYHSIGGLHTWIKPEIQSFTIDPTKSNTLECQEGTLIIIPANSIEDKNGNRIAENVTVEIVEALTIDKMVAYNLTTTANGQALTSGGMLYIQPKANGEDLTFSKNLPCHVEIPCDEFNPEMKAWEGVTASNGNINWENPTELERFLVPVDFSTLDFLPRKFRPQFQSQLPFQNYAVSSVALEDSFYYSLRDQLTETNDQKIVDTNSTIESNKNVSDRLRIFPFGFLGSLLHQKDKSFYSLQINGLQSDFKKNAIVTLDYGKGLSNSYPIDKDGMVYFPILSDGKFKVRIITDNCDPVEHNSVTFIQGKITSLEFEEKNCITTPLSVTEACYIDPSSIKAIRQKKFEKTFLATKEFEERLVVLHTIKNAQELFELYLNNLTKKLWEVDQMVADRLSGDAKSQFEEFANQKLTNVDLKNINTADLVDYYNESRKKFQDETKKRNQELASKTQNELSVLSKKMADLLANSTTKISDVKSFNANVTINLPIIRNSVATQNSYKINWYNPGWMNIDAYLHELSKGEKLLTINAKDWDENAKIYQCINSLKTIIGLNKVNNDYTAHYPDASNPISNQFKKTYCVGVARQEDGKLLYTSSEFNPYTINSILLQWEAIPEKELIVRLQKLSPNNSDLVKSIREENKKIKEALEIKQKQEAIQKERNRIFEEEKKHAELVKKLVDSIDPCSDGYIPEIEESENTIEF